MLQRFESSDSDCKGLRDKVSDELIDVDLKYAMAGTKKILRLTTSASRTLPASYTSGDV